MSAQLEKKRYRPSLPAHLVQHMLSLAKREQPLSQESIQLIGILAPFEAKILAGTITPAHTLKDKPSTLELLGETTMNQQSQLSNKPSSIPLSLSKEVFWEKSWERYTTSPESCTLLEIEAAREWAYLQDLMTEEEIAEFESSKKES